MSSTSTERRVGCRKRQHRYLNELLSINSVVLKRSLALKDTFNFCNIYTISRSKPARQLSQSPTHLLPHSPKSAGVNCPLFNIIMSAGPESANMRVLFSRIPSCFALLSFTYAKWKADGVTTSHCLPLPSLTLGSEPGACKFAYMFA